MITQWRIKGDTFPHRFFLAEQGWAWKKEDKSWRKKCRETELNFNLLMGEACGVFTVERWDEKHKFWEPYRSDTQASFQHWNNLLREEGL